MYIVALFMIQQNMKYQHQLTNQTLQKHVTSESLVHMRLLHHSATLTFTAPLYHYITPACVPAKAKVF